MTTGSPIHAGLEGIKAGRTSICEVDEDRAELFYCGYSILELAERATFEEVAYLLLNGELPSQKDLDTFCRQLVAERAIPEKVRDIIRLLPKTTDPMDVLKMGVGLLHTTDPDASSNTKDANMRKAIRLIAQIPTIISYHYHISQGSEPVNPSPNLPFAANLLYIIKGKEPEGFESDILDRSLILYAEHEFNASTYVARVIASTLSDIHSAVIGAIAALKGPLHGGANERAMEMLLEIGVTEKAESWIKDALSKKKRIMGFGHRVYKRQDPRTPIIKKMAKGLGERFGNTRWFEISQRVEEIMDREKGLHANLDFYSSSTYYLLGIPIPLYTPIFVASRVTGWVSHVIEQYNDNRLIRPRAEYIGHGKRGYISIEDR